MWCVVCEIETYLDLGVNFNGDIDVWNNNIEAEQLGLSMLEQDEWERVNTAQAGIGGGIPVRLCRADRPCGSACPFVELYSLFPIRNKRGNCTLM